MTAKKKTFPKSPLAVICSVLGLAISIQIKSPLQSQVERSVYEEYLITRINQERAHSQAIKRQRETVRDSHIPKGPPRELGTLGQQKKIFGFESVSGQGLRVELSCAFEEQLAVMLESRRLFPMLLNELKAYGATALAINGQRVTINTPVTLAGNHLLVNQVAIAPPYQIDALGDPAVLYDGLQNRSYIVDVLKNAWSVQVALKREDHLVIPGVFVPQAFDVPLYLKKGDR